MTNKIKYIIAMAMAVLMTVATFGTVAVCATVLPADPEFYGLDQNNYAAKLDLDVNDIVLCK